LVFDLRRRPHLILLSLDPGQHFAEPLVLGDRRVRDALLLVEDGVGQGTRSPSNVQPTFGELVDIDVFADQPARKLVLLKHDLPAFVGERQLLADITLLPLAPHVTQPIRRNIQCAMHVVRSGRDLGEPLTA
jgi:hypothetical protein